MAGSKFEISQRAGHDMTTTTTTIPSGRISELVQYFLRLGFRGFGGPVALVGQMERELVDERKWLTKEQMRESIAICQSLPGPLAIQVGIYVSYLRGGFWGAWAGGWAFILPNFVIVAHWELSMSISATCSR
jgi:chromate transporter